MTMSATPTREQIGSEITDLERRLAMYREMLAIAERCDDDYECERITRNIDEWENGLDDAITRAILAGFGPDDFA